MGSDGQRLKMLQVLRREKLRQGRPLCKTTLGQHGQSTIEYMLILIISIILILSLLYRFQSSFRSYAEAFFDGYIRCLLETGELPGTGSICPQAFTTFDAKSGKGLLKDNIPGGNGSNGSGKNKDDQKKISPKGGETVSRGGGGGGSATVGRFGGSGARSTTVGTISGGGSDSSAGSPKNQLQMGRGTAVGRIGSSGRPAMSSVEERTQYASEEDPKKPKAAATGKKAAAGGDNLRPGKQIENLDRKPARVVNLDTQEFTISGLIRILIIVLIIVAMVVFFGGQLLQISKSREKGGD